jgi:hypothetical protein
MNVFIPSASWAGLLLRATSLNLLTEASFFSLKYSTNGELKAGKPREISIKPVAIKNNHKNKSTRRL